MEIQIPVAEQDTATESLGPTLTDRTGPTLTDRTGYQTMSENWSQEGQASTTARSLAPSCLSQPPTAPDGDPDTQHGDHSGDGDGYGEGESSPCGDGGPSDAVAGGPVVGSVTEEDSAAAASQDRDGDPDGKDGSSPYGNGNPSDTGGGKDGVVGDPDDEGRKEHGSQGEVGGGDPLPEPGVGSDQQEEAGDDDADTAAQNPSSELGATQQPDSVSEDSGANNVSGSDAPRLQNDDVDQPSTVEDNVDADAQDVEINGSEDNSPSRREDMTIPSEGTVQADDEEEQKPETINELENPKAEEHDKNVFLTENANPDDGSDISDVRADTPNWAEEEEENEDEEEGGGKGGKVGMVLSDEDEVHQRQESLSLASHARPLTRSSLHESIAPGHRAVVNTPVSYYTTLESARNVESRNTSHVESTREAAFQRAMTLMSSRCENSQDPKTHAQQVGSALFGYDDSQYGYKYPQYFYVQQRKPAPTAPLKVWKGYHGNVYFEPITISGLAGGGGGGGDMSRAITPASALSGRKSSAASRRGKARSVTATTTRSHSQALVHVSIPGDTAPQSDTRSLAGRSRTSVTVKQRRGGGGGGGGPMSAKSAASARSVAAMSQHHILYLDKQAVTMREELEVMEKQQSTGSLNIQPRGVFQHSISSVGGSERGGGGGGGRTVTTTTTTTTTNNNNRNNSNKRSGASSAKFDDRVCRGSVAHKLCRARSGNVVGTGGHKASPRGSGGPNPSPSPRQQREEPPPSGNTRQHQGGWSSSTELMVVGDRFSHSSLMSPLLRTQTQYSLSNHRMTVNSPDLYGGAFDRLPPLEQVRISLRHMDSRGDDGLNNNTSITGNSNSHNNSNNNRNKNRVGSPYNAGPGRVVVEELKPFIKYSPEIKAQFNRQIKYY